MTTTKKQITKQQQIKNLHSVDPRERFTAVLACNTCNWTDIRIRFNELLQFDPVVMVRRAVIEVLYGPLFHLSLEAFKHACFDPDASVRFAAWHGLRIHPECNPESFKALLGLAEKQFPNNTFWLPEPTDELEELTNTRGKRKHETKLLPIESLLEGLKTTPVDLHERYAHLLYAHDCKAVLPTWKAMISSSDYTYRRTCRLVLTRLHTLPVHPQNHLAAMGLRLARKREFECIGWTNYSELRV